MRIGNIEGTSEELKQTIIYSGLNVEDYFPQKSKHGWVFIITIIVAILLLKLFIIF